MPFAGSSRSNMPPLWGSSSATTPTRCRRRSRPGLSDIFRRSIIVCAVVVILASLSSGTALASIVLLYFRATAQVDNSIKVEWATGSEVGIVAFRLWRSEDAGSVGLPVAMLPAQGDPVTGATYMHVDPRWELIPEHDYYYRLEVLDAQGGSTWNGPVSVRTGPPPSFVFLPLVLRD